MIRLLRDDTARIRVQMPKSIVQVLFNCKSKKEMWKGAGMKRERQREIKQKIVWSTLIDPVASPWSFFTHFLSVVGVPEWFSLGNTFI